MKLGRKRKTTAQFILEAIAIHGMKYDYSKSVYRGSLIKLTIICPKHGEFAIIPNNHLIGQGCNKCWLDRCKQPRITEDMIIERAREVHEKKYWYNLMDYKGWHTKVDILCPAHGVFSQTPLNHVNNKQGCPECGGCRIIVPGNPGHARYTTYGHRLLPVHSPVEGEHGELLVSCHVCGEQFAPSHHEVSAVCMALVSLKLRTTNLYCSNSCKKKDPKYRKQLKPLGDDHIKASEVARKMCWKHKADLLNVQRAEYGHTFCECCGEDRDDIELHHTIRVVDDPWTAMDPDTHMIACEECHQVIHNRCRLPTRIELQEDIDAGALNDLSDESIRIRLRLLQDQIDDNGNSFCNHCNTSYSGKAHRNKELYLTKDPEGLLNTFSEDNLLLCFRCVIRLYKTYTYNRVLNRLLKAMYTLRR